MTKADARDRALLHDLHIEMASHRFTPIGDEALRAVVRVALAYTHVSSPDDSISRDVIEEFDEDSLALVEILTLAVLQRKTSMRDVENLNLGFG